MRTTKTYARRACRALALLLAVIAFDVVLTLVLEQYGTATEVTWYNYRNTPGESIDTLVVGSSFASFGVDPHSIDEEAGTSSFNLSTMAQTFPNSRDIVRSVQKDHQLKRIVICLGTESLQRPAQYDREITFLQAKSAGDSFDDVLQNVATLALDESYFPTSKSIGWIFPWTYTSVGLEADEIRTNIERRLSMPDPTDAMLASDSAWQYLGQGHCAYDKHLNLRSPDSNQLAIDSSAPFLEKTIQEFVDLLDTCTEIGISPMVIVAPRPDYANVAHQTTEYAELMASLQAIAVEHGATYYDFNLAHPDFYRPLDSDFSDAQHLNVDGSKSFSHAIGQLIAQDEAGEDVGVLFYSYDDWDTYLASYPDIALCYCEYEVGSDSFAISASCIAQKDVAIEYQFEVKHKGSKRFKVARAYASDSSYDLPIEGHGSVVIRVRARVVGSTTKDAMRSCKYWTAY